MQKFNLDISIKRVIPLLYVKQRDVGTKILVEITNNGDAYAIPAGASFSVWYSGASGEGNYTKIGENSAFSIDGNTVTVELIMQMLNNPGGGKMCLVMNGTDGSQLGLWDIPYFVEAIPGADSEAALTYYTAFQEHIVEIIAAANRAIVAAEALEGGLVLKKGQGQDSVAQVSTTGNDNTVYAPGGIALGMKAVAGIKGFHMIDVNADDLLITVDDADLVDKAANVYAVGDALMFDAKNHYYCKLEIVSLATNAAGQSIIGVKQTTDETLNLAQDADPAENYCWVPGKHYGEIFNMARAADSRGENTIAAGRCSSATGRDTKALGNYSNASGRETTAGYVAHVEGRKTKATGDYSHGEGYESTASGYASHAENKSTATGQYSHSEGCDTLATGNCAHAEGQKAKAVGGHSHAEGYNTLAEKPQAHAEGSGSVAKGIASHAEGLNTTAEADASHSEGADTTAGGPWAHAEGYDTTAKGDGSHAEGKKTQANGPFAHAEGIGTVAESSCSHAEGKDTCAKGAYTHTEGLGTVATVYGQHVQGRYNEEDTENQYAHIVGGGSSDTERKDIHTIDWEGNAMFAGTYIMVGGQTLTAETIAMLNGLKVSEGVAF